MKDFNENIKKVVAAINSASPEQYTYVCESTPEPDLYKMARHAYEKVLNVSLLLDEIQGKIPHDRLVLYERGKTAKKAVGQALDAVYAVIAEISRREQPTVEQFAKEQSGDGQIP